MGWCCEDGTHEGYLVGLVHDDQGVFSGHAGYGRGQLTGRMRELGARADDHVCARVPVTWVKCACACGWRSPLIRVPFGTSAEWMPSSVVAPEAFEDACRVLWEAHVQTTGPAPDGGCSVSVLVQQVARAGGR